MATYELDIPWKLIEPDDPMGADMVDVSGVKRKWLDVPYASQSPSQVLDIYLPETGSGPFPTFTDAEILDYMTAPIKANPGLPFFIYAACGGMRDTPSMRRQIALLIEQGGFSYGKDPAENQLLFSVSDYYHSDYLVPYYFWNYLKVIFQL